MTKKEMFEAIKVAVADNAEMVEFLDKEIALVEKRNSRKSTALTKTQKENIEIKERILNVLAEFNGVSASAVAGALDISVAKASALLTQLVKEEKVERVKSGRNITFNIR